MARLLEFEGKQLLALHGIAVPQGRLCRSAEECRQEAARLGGDVVVKAQVWSTQRAAAGLVSFDVAACVGMLARASAVLVEQRLPIEREYYAAVVVDDALRRLVLLLGAAGGTGVEDRSASVTQLPLSVTREPTLGELTEFSQRADLADVLLRLCRVARTYEARSVEINPLALCSGQWTALDCRISVDDYAVFRHPELGINVARELDHPPTELDRI